MKTMRQKQVYSTIRNIVVLTFIISGCSGLIHAFFKCSNYTFHENSTEGRSWETSRLLCQNSSEGDLVSIEEEEERNFVKNIIKNLTATKYFIGLKKDNGKWKWLSDQTAVDSSKGKSPWAPNQPSGTSSNLKVNCATMYGKYRSYFGLFDDNRCRRRIRDAGLIRERAVSCTKHERGTSLTKKPSQVTPVHSITRKSSQGQRSAYFRAEIEWTASNSHATKEKQKATSVHSTTKTPGKSQRFFSTAEIDSIVPEATHLEKADETSYLIVIIGSVLAASVLLGTGVAILLFLIYRPRKKGSKLKIQRYQRQSNSIRLKGLDNTSQAEQEMDDWESLPEVKRQDACVTSEEGDGGSFLSMQESSTKRPKEAFIEEQSSTNSYCDPLHISATTKPSKVVVKKDTPEEHKVNVHIHSKQDKTAFHLDHVKQDLGEGPSQVIDDEENCKPSAAVSSAGIEKELTRDEDAIVKQNASGQDQCINCVYAVVDKTKKKRPPTKKPVPYHELVYADLSHSPKKARNGRIHQESTATIYADIDHIKSSAMSDSRSQQDNEVKPTE
ncbi:PREDICTED: uncharacterized protein LOC107339813 isoform X1 [Acropora digitifera]|uniref:uncharacterized protein LOC107339813 isoform X1 n=1 Tax=Acropora digitifera TaxID=70779 RepID=UPI00077A84D8|nr:PREDICTED: uncharacterized protein LOC107339813 isoform X1 [Acropora digitifera]